MSHTQNEISIILGSHIRGLIIFYTSCEHILSTVCQFVGRKRCFDAMRKYPLDIQKNKALNLL